MSASPSTDLFQLHADAFAAVEQPLQVKAGQRVAGVQPDQRGERRHRPRVAGLQLGESLGILPDRGPLERRRPQWLVGPKRLAAPAQQQIADRPALEIRRAFGDAGADANARAEKLVGGLEPRRDVDGVAIGSVIEEAVAAEIADQRRAGVNADTGGAEIHALGLPALAKRLRPDVETMRAGDRARRIIRLVAGSV